MALAVQYDIVAKTVKAQKAIDDLVRKEKGLNSTLAKTSSATKKASSSSKVLTTRFRSLSKAITPLRTGIAALLGAYGLTRVSKTFLQAAADAEKYRVIANTVTRSTEEGARAFSSMSKYAMQVPFQFEDIIKAGVRLLPILENGVDDMNKWLPVIGDIAAVSGLSIELVTGQMIKALSGGIGAARTFKTHGIANMMGFENGVAVSAKRTAERMMNAWTDPQSVFKDATLNLATTWIGTVSMMQDKWFFFRNMIMDGGPFQFLKSALTDVNKRLMKMFDSGELKKFTDRIGKVLVDALKTTLLVGAQVLDRVLVPIFSVLGAAYDGFMAQDKWLREIGIVGGFLFGIKGALVVAAISLVSGELKKITDEYERFVNLKGGTALEIDSEITKLKNERAIFLMQKKAFAQKYNISEERVLQNNFGAEFTDFYGIQTLNKNLRVTAEKLVRLNEIKKAGSAEQYDVNVLVKKEIELLKQKQILAEKYKVSEDEPELDLVKAGGSLRSLQGLLYSNVDPLGKELSDYDKWIDLNGALEENTKKLNVAHMALQDKIQGKIKEAIPEKDTTGLFGGIFDAITKPFGDKNYDRVKEWVDGLGDTIQKEMPKLEMQKDPVNQKKLRKWTGGLEKEYLKAIAWRKKIVSTFETARIGTIEDPRKKIEAQRKSDLANIEIKYAEEIRLIKAYGNKKVEVDRFIALRRSEVNVAADKAGDVLIKNKYNKELEILKASGAEEEELNTFFKDKRSEMGTEAYKEIERQREEDLLNIKSKYAEEIELLKKHGDDKLSVSKFIENKGLQINVEARKKIQAVDIKDLEARKRIMKATEEARIGAITDPRERMLAQHQSELAMIEIRYAKEIELMREYGYEKIKIEKFINDKKDQLDENYRRSQQAESLSNLGLIQSQMGEFSSFFQEMSQANIKAAKKWFKVYKALSFAESLISTYSAYTKALNSTLPVGVRNIYAGSILALGMAKAGMIASQQPPSFDTGGISTTPGMYYAGVKEAHIPLQGGNIPVNIKGNTGNTININMDGATFLDQETMRQSMTVIAAQVTRQLAPEAVVSDYFNDGQTREVFYGRE